jgi:hypothetical protein
MTQNKVLILPLVVAVAATFAEALAEIGRKRLATDLFDFEIESIATALGRRRSRDRSVRPQKAACPPRTHKPFMPLRKRGARHN